MVRTREQNKVEANDPPLAPEFSGETKEVSRMASGTVLLLSRGGDREEEKDGSKEILSESSIFIARATVRKQRLVEEDGRATRVGGRTDQSHREREREKTMETLKRREKKG